MKTPYQHYVTGILFALATVLLNGCSSGGSSSVASTYTVGGTITSLSSSGLVLQNNGSDDLAVAGNSFEFATVLADGASYDVTVLTQPTGQSCDVAGGNGTVSGANVSNMIVTCRGWSTAVSIETENDGDAFGPQIAVDAAGNTLAVWYQSDGTRNNIWANRYTAGSGWGTAELIETGDGHALGPQIAIDAAGNALAVWDQDGITRRDIWANRYTVGSGWGVAELIEFDNAGNASQPQISIDAAGNALVVWSQRDVLLDIWANRYTAGIGWGTAELIDAGSSGSASSPQIATDAAGNGLAVWVQKDGTKDSAWANYYTVGSGWGTAELLENDDTGFVSVPQITIDTAGNALAVWEQSTVSGSDIWSNRYLAGSGWGIAELIETTNTGSAFGAQIATDATGNALAVWVQDDGARYNVTVNRYTIDNGWGTAELIAPADAEDAFFPQITIDANGNALAVWQKNDGTRINIMANRYTAGSGWGTAELIENQIGNAANAQVSFDASGNALAVWFQFDGIFNNIWSNRFH